MDANAIREQLTQAHTWLRADQPERAESILRALFDDGHRSFDLLIELTLCHLMLGQDHDARRYLSMAAALDGQHSRVLCYHGFLALVAGQHEVALGFFNDSLQAAPGNAEAYKWRGLCLRELGEPERALADLDRAATQLHNDATLLINRGTVHSDLGDLRRALRDFEHATLLAPDHAHAFFNAGHVLVDLDRLDEARECYDRAIEIDAFSIEAWMGLAGLFSHRDDPCEALRCYATVLAFEPDHPEAHLRLALLLMKRADHTRALDHLDRVMSLTPGDPEVLVQRAVALFHLGRFGPCIADCEHALRLRADVGLAHLYRALAHLELGTHPTEGPLDDLQRARQLDPVHPGPPLALAELLLSEARVDDASQMLSDALVLSPDLAPQLALTKVFQPLLQHPHVSNTLQRVLASPHPQLLSAGRRSSGLDPLEDGR